MEVPDDTRAYSHPKMAPVISSAAVASGTDPRRSARRPDQSNRVRLADVVAEPGTVAIARHRFPVGAELRSRVRRIGTLDPVTEPQQ
jgi:hypothetical protein